MKQQTMFSIIMYISKLFGLSINTIILQVGFGFWLSMLIFGLPSPSRCWPFQKIKGSKIRIESW